MKYPLHLAIIPDGCRRWAKKRKLNPWEGHKQGIKTLREIGNFSLKNFPIKYYTIYGLSFENLQRTKLELKKLEKLYSKHFLELANDETIHSGEVNVGVIGKRELLPKRLLKSIEIVEEKTKEYRKKFFRFALAYSGRMEIVDAVNKIIKNGKEVNVKEISKNLYFKAPDPDLLIRTAEKRISNFLLWKIAYSEIYFVDKLWPDFTKEDLIKAIEFYSKIQRKFGR